MKKLISMLLVLSMLCSMLPLGVTATEIDMTETETVLSENVLTYISLEEKADVDAYASLETIADYSRFNKPIASGSDYFATTTYNGQTVFNWLPDKTYAGETITGTEGYYYKGFYTKALVESKNTLPAYVMLADDLLEDDGTTVTGYRYDAGTNANPSMIYDGAERVETTRTVNAAHVVDRLDENGKKYAIISNNGIKHKIGPVDGSVYSPNSVYLSNGSVTIPVEKKGEALSILVGTNNFSGHNYTPADTAVGAAPKASMNKITVTYADGTKATKYFVMVNTISYTDYNKPAVDFAIVYAPKKETWTEEDLYGSAKVTAKYLTNANSAEHGIEDTATLTPADIVFENPNIIMTETANVASWINNRQDALTGNVGNRVTMANIALEDKEVASFTMTKFYNYIQEAIPTSIPVGTNETQVRQAFIPVTVNGASDEYDYFAYVGATTDYCALLGATVVDASLQTSIDELNEVLKALDSATLTEEQIADYRAQINNLKAQSEYVTDEMFDTSALEEAEKRIEKESADKERAEALAFKPYEYVELNLFQDIFATYAERQSADWYAWAEGDITTIWPYKGINNAIEPKYPFSRTGIANQYALMIDLEGGESYTNAISLKNNPMVSYDEALQRYIVKSGNVTYKLGEIAEGKKGGNFATFGVKYDTQNYTIASGLNITEQELDAETYPNIGTATQIGKAIYQINKSGVSEINLLMTSTVASSAAKNTAVYVPATITYTDGVNDTKEQVGFVVGSIGSSFQASTFAVKTSEGYNTVDDVKANAVAGNEAAGKELVNSNVTLPQLETRTTYIPENSFRLATMMRSYKDGEFAGYVHSFTVPVDSTRTIKSIELIKDTNISTKFFDPNAATLATGTSGSATCLIPFTVNGVSDEYTYYFQSTRNCGAAGIFAMTLTEKSLNDKVADLQYRMTTARLQADVDAIETEMAELIETTVVEKSDFDEDALAAFEIRKVEIAKETVELERLESLKEEKYTYLDLPKDRDVFVNFNDLINYGRFNTAAIKEGSETKRVNEKFAYAEGIELFRYLPHITADGTPVTGQEDYYFRGFYNAANNNLPAAGERGYVNASGYAYLTDSFFEENETVLKGMRVNAKATETGESTSVDYYEGRLQRIEETKTIKTPNFVQKLDEDGYAIIKNGDVQSKIGPISKTEIKPNAVRLGNSAGTVLSDVNVKGSNLDLLITSTYVNVAGGYTTSKLATAAIPTATLQEVVINYKDGSFDTKKVLVIHNATTSSTNTAYKSIVFAPKYNDAGEKIVYTGESFYNESASNSFTMVNSKNVVEKLGLTSADQINTETVKFENDDIIYSTVGTLASMVNNRMDTAVSNYGTGTSYASIPLQNKEIDKIAFNYNISAALEEASAIVVSNDKANASNPSIALLPIEIEGASEEYVYFVYCGRLAQDSYLMAATVRDSSAREKIDAAKAAMEAITENSKLSEAKKAKELYEMAIAEENVVIEKDFGALVTEFFDLYEVIRNNTPLTSKTKITFYAGEAPKADVTIINESEIADKPYKVMMAYYNEKGVMIDKMFAEGVSTEEVETTFTVTKEDYNPETKKVKVFVWKDLSTILPLADVTVADVIEKKIYMFVGASIVQGDNFTKPTELYYMTRFPYAPADFYNKGRGGSTAESIMKRYDWDIQSQDATHVILTVGTNDIGYTSYSDASSELREAAVNKAATNITSLLVMMAEDYNDVTYMLPPIFDDRDYTGARAKYTGANAAMEKLGELTSAMAEENGYRYVDNYVLTKEVNEKEEIWNSGAVEMYSTDRVHPNTQGGYVLAYSVIKNLFPDSGVVGAVVIDAGNGQVKTDNADVTDVVASLDSVKYTYKAKALPWTYTDAYKKADGRYVDLTNELNQEIIKVTGLAEGTYTLKMDGVTVGQYTSAELAEGINIANEVYNPGQIQSNNVNKLNESKHVLVGKIRGYALAKEQLINDGAVDRVTGEIIDRTKFDETVQKKVAAKAYCYEYFENYETYDKQYPTWVEESENYTLQMREAAIPETHTVEITK